MSGINIVRNLQVLYFSGENKEIKNLKNDEKFVAQYRQLYMLLIQLELELAKANLYTRKDFKS